MRAVDTNVLVRLVTRDDARKRLRPMPSCVKAAWVSLLALTEAIWVLPPCTNAVRRARHCHRDAAEPRTSGFAGLDAVAAALDLFRSRPSLGFSDCLMLQVARKAGHLPLGAFDRGLGKIERAQKLSCA